VRADLIAVRVGRILSCCRQTDTPSHPRDTPGCTRASWKASVTWRAPARRRCHPARLARPSSRGLAQRLTCGTTTTPARTSPQGVFGDNVIGRPSAGVSQRGGFCLGRTTGRRWGACFRRRRSRHPCVRVSRSGRAPGGEEAALIGLLDCIHAPRRSSCSCSSREGQRSSLGLALSPFVRREPGSGGWSALAVLGKQACRLGPGDGGAASAARCTDTPKDG
jgi:hypothetical protein